MGIKKELGKKIKQYRTSKGYTQEKLSEMADITQKALSSIEVGDNFVTAETLDKLLKALEITPQELFSTDNVKDSAELVKMINQNIAEIGNNPEKLVVIYNLTQSLK